MSRTETRNNSAIGLDVGTSRIVTARQANQEIKYDIQLNAFVTIPYSKMTENVLRRRACRMLLKGMTLSSMATSRSGLRTCLTKTSGVR